MSQSQNPSVASSVVGTPELEARDFRQELINSSQVNGSFWGRTFNQAFSWINKTNSQPLEEKDCASNSTGISLNAYLTYVTLKIPLIMIGEECGKYGAA